MTKQEFLLAKLSTDEQQKRINSLNRCGEECKVVAGLLSTKSDSPLIENPLIRQVENEFIKYAKQMGIAPWLLDLSMRIEWVYWVRKNLEQEGKQND